MRAFMNEGGRVAYTGKRAGQQFTGAAVGTQFFDPKNEDAVRCTGQRVRTRGIRAGA